ncbi:hypothetical protein [Longispora albida]|uniref:hypothetical protein n=1 Tax=Longispora albida TaxID=203523 RepID=UPI00036F75A4|nr:hypothetical protein [Longispora albida]
MKLFPVQEASASEVGILCTSAAGCLDLRGQQVERVAPYARLDGVAYVRCDVYSSIAPLYHPACER